MKKNLFFIFLFLLFFNFLISQNFNVFSKKESEKKIEIISKLEKLFIEIQQLYPQGKEYDVDRLISSRDAFSKYMKSLPTIKKEDKEKILSFEKEISELQKKLTESKTNYVIPIGADAGTSISSSESGNAGPCVGFQIFKEDDFFASAFFNYSGRNEVSGNQGDFGSLLLNPSSNCMGVYLSGNISTNLLKSETFFLGFSGRAGITFTKWIDSATENDPGINGLILYFDPAVQITTKTFKLFGDNKSAVSFELGYHTRFLGGDLAQNSNDSFRSLPNILGTAKKFLGSLGFTVSMRVNKIMPYARITWFSVKDTDVSGLTGLQAYLGVEVLSSLIQGELSNKKEK